MSLLPNCSRLVEYSSDEDESSSEISATSNEKTLDNNVISVDEKNSLPLPSEIHDMFKKSEKEHVDDPSKHDGKIRSFPHERGVWATYVFIEYDSTSDFFEMINELQRVARKYKVDLEIPESFHVSLSKTVKLRHHWIQPFIDSLKIHLSTFYRFKLMLQSLEVYENEEKTRTFLGMKVHLGFESLLKLTKKVDLCLADFQLPCFYKNPSFHLSFASCIGSKSEIIETFLPELNVVFHSFVENNAGCRAMWVTKVSCKSGNKLFSISLKN